VTFSQSERYARQIRLPEINEEGQARLARSSVAIVGAGGLGSPAAIYLAAAGVGTIGLVDFDRVELSNLHRQILYGESDVGRQKLDAAEERLRSLNADVRVITHDERLSASNALRILEGYDVVLDGTDNFATRYLVNDACTLLRRPNVYGSVLRFDGQVSVLNTPDGPCYRCLHPDPPPPDLIPSCGEAGVLGVVPGVVGTMQAAEAIKLITGAGEPLVGRLLLIDLLRMSFRSVRLQRRCGEHSVVQFRDHEELCHPMNETQVTPAEIAERISKGQEIILIDVREPMEWNTGHVDSAHHIPMSQVPTRLDEIPRDRDVVMICRSGARSERVRQFLVQQGYTRVANLTGGMQRWAREVDPSIRVA
jgi:adenylyltransferase/sulfurtransferase